MSNYSNCSKCGLEFTVGSTISWASDGFVYCVPHREEMDVWLRKQREDDRLKRKKEYEDKGKK